MRVTGRTFLVVALAIGLTAHVACTEDDPEETPLPDMNPDPNPQPTPDPDATPDVMPDMNPDVMPDMNPDVMPDMVVCEPLETDYAPGADDTYPACISDDGTYHQFEMTISSIGRVGGFEAVADILWRIEGAPSADAFLEARDVYAPGEGLDSRVQRREDEHYPVITNEMGEVLQCRDEGVPELDPQRCVGPALILPILNEAFQKGFQGEGEGRVHAARIEAALLWFLYVSSHKEATTCSAKKKDCDSAYAYYTGGVPQDQGLGLAGYVRALDEDAHDRIWEGILAVRCWRDLDNAEVAEDLEAQARAVLQLDTALLYGVSIVVLDRLAQMAQQSGAEAEASWAFVQILGAVLLREADERDPTGATALQGELAKASAAEADVELMAQTLQAVFPCP